MPSQPDPRPETETPPPPATPAPRVLFLDDDPARAEVFLAARPEAVWVQTVEECLAKLEEPWDEIHLDHDLGGEHFVDSEREDCGMEVVRWLTLTPRPYLRPAKILVHSHNTNAALMMGLQLVLNGYAAVVRPFGAPEPEEREAEVETSEPFAASPTPPSLIARFARMARRLMGREVPEGEPEDEDYGYTAYDRDASPDDPSPPRLDFSWARPVASNESPKPPDLS